MRKHNGFTLLEVLIALFIFTIVSIMMVTGLRTVLNSQSYAENYANKLSRLQIALLVFSRDIEQAVNRPIVNAKGSSDAAFIGEPHNLTFTHMGHANPLSIRTQSTLQRVNYTLDHQSFVRETWQVLDQVAKTKPDSRKLIQDVRQLRFEYLNSQGKFTDRWPEGSTTQSALPTGVRITLTFAHGDTLTDFFVIPVTGLDSAKKT